MSNFITGTYIQLSTIRSGLGYQLFKSDFGCCSLDLLGEHVPDVAIGKGII